MSKPVYDPVSGNPMYAPGDIADKPIKSICCCPTDAVFSYSFDLTGCTESAGCDPGAKSGSMSYQATYDDQDVCTWDDNIAPFWNISLAIHFNGTCDLSISEQGYPGLPPLQCWIGDLGTDGSGNPIKFDCAGSNVFYRAGGNCSGPATITISAV